MNELRISSGTAQPYTNQVAVSSSDETIRLQDIWLLLRRNKGLIALGLVIGIASSAVYLHFATPVYQASASIRIDDKQNNLPVLDVLRDMSPGSELATEMEVLRSRTLAEGIVDSLALQFDLREPKRTLRSQIFSAVDVSKDAPAGEYQLKRHNDGRFQLTEKNNATSRLVRVGERVTVPGAEFVLARDAAKKPEIVFAVRTFNEETGAFTRAISVSRPSREANVVVVRYQGTDPQLVRAVPNALASTFIAARRDVKKTESRSTVQFLRRQLDTLTLQLRQSEDSLRDFRQDARVVSPADEATAQVKRLVELQAERSNVDAERSALARLLAEVRSVPTNPDSVSPYRRVLAFPTLLQNSASTQLLTSLMALEDQRATLMIRRTALDPDVQTLTGRIHEVEQQIQQMADTYLQGLTSQVASIDTELNRFSSQLEKVPATEVEFARLQRRPKVLEGIFVMLQTRLKEAEIVQAVEDPSVRVIDAAILPDLPIKPKRSFVLVFGAIAGLFAGILIAFGRQVMDRTVHSRDDVQRITGAQVLGVIPHIRGALGTDARAVGSLATLKQLLPAAVVKLVPQPRVPALPAPAKGTALLESRLIAGTDPRSPVSEAYRALRTNITFSHLDKAAKTFVFTSAMPSEGKTTSASNFAITLVQQGLRVLLVDADLRRGLLNSVFNVPREPGLSNVLAGGKELSAAVRSIDLGEMGTLHLLAAGHYPPNPAELLGSERMRSLLATMREEFDAVVLDAPPLNLVTDAAVLGTFADGVLLVARAGVTSTSDLSFATSQLAAVRAPLLGAVLNDIDFARDGGYGSYGAYDYYYAGSEA